MKRKVVVGLLTMLLVISPFFSLSVSANPELTPEEYNQIVYDYAYEIHRKYGIDIRYPIREDGYAAIGSGTLETLDKTLMYITPSVVSQLSKYYYATRDSFLTFRFTYLPDDLKDMDISALARFSPDEGVIDLFIPHSSTPMILTGCSPIAVAHEIGHAFYTFFTEKQGLLEFRRSWSSFNNYQLYANLSPNNYNKYQFVSHYASANEEEDFAETFAYAFTANRAGLGISKFLKNPDHSASKLGKKVSYLKNILPRYLTNTYQAIQNISKTQNTPSKMSYHGTQLSGNSLEYIGFQAPYGILPTILSVLKIKEKESEWILDIGGWKVTDINGGVYLIFPGATFVTLKISPSKS